MSKHTPIIEQIRQGLARSGLTQQQLADASGVARNRISEALTGKRGITVETADKLLGALIEMQDLERRPRHKMRPTEH